jgi:hypothetical protein
MLLMIKVFSAGRWVCCLIVCAGVVGSRIMEADKCLKPSKLFSFDLRNLINLRGVHNAVCASLRRPPFSCRSVCCCMPCTVRTCSSAAPTRERLNNALFLSGGTCVPAAPYSPEFMRSSKWDQSGSGSISIHSSSTYSLHFFSFVVVSDT